MIWLILVLIYLVSFAIHILLIYLENKWWIYDVGDIIDKIKLFMWVPFVNTIALIVFGIAFIIDEIICRLKLSVLWQKFRNIKIK